MKTKTIVAVSVLLASCAAVAADSPFEKGKTYILGIPGVMSNTKYEIKDIKGKWLLINNEQICKQVESNECWVNSDNLDLVSQQK